MIKKFSDYFIIIIFSGSLIMAGSCKKSIELKDIGEFTSETSVTTETDLTDLINSAYFALADENYYGGSFQIYNELLADHLDGTNLGGFFQAFYNRNTNIFNSDNASFYGQINKVIFQSNLVLDNLSIATDANKNEFEGEAKFLRSIAIFDLVRMYAQPYTTAGAASQIGIPIRLTGVRQIVQRSTVADAYQLIISDLKTAETMLPETNGVNATKWSAKALLAKVYFQMNDFANAYLYADDVLANGGFGFDTAYNERYSPQGTSETIFGLVYESGNTQGRFQKLRNNYLTTSTALPTLRLTNAFYTEATANSDDKRISWYKTNNGFYLLGKFDSASIRLPVIHVTEIKLIFAESAAEINLNLSVAISDLNDIIIRAYGVTSSLILPLTANATVIIDAARRERQLELVGEGNRLQELKRIAAKGEPVTIRGSAFNCPGLIFPFPSNEAIYLGIPQNPTGGCN